MKQITAYEVEGMEEVVNDIAVSFYRGVNFGGVDVIIVVFAAQPATVIDVIDVGRLWSIGGGKRGSWIDFEGNKSYPNVV